MTGEEASSRGWDRGRLDAFSDGVFAIAITILVLEIKVPADLRHLGRDLEHEWPDYLAFLPFSTAVLAEALRATEHTAEIAVVLYGGTVLVIELVLQALTRYVASRPQPGEDDESEEAKAAIRRSRLSPIIVFYAVAIGVALVGFPKERGSVIPATRDPERSPRRHTPPRSSQVAHHLTDEAAALADGWLVELVSHARYKRLVPIVLARRPRIRRRARSRSR